MGIGGVSQSGCAGGASPRRRWEAREATRTGVQGHVAEQDSVLAQRSCARGGAQCLRALVSALGQHREQQREGPQRVGLCVRLARCVLGMCHNWDGESLPV